MAAQKRDQDSGGAGMPEDFDDHEQFMAQAIELAEQAGDLEEVPVGALVVDSRGEVIGRGYNKRRCERDPTAHAEMIALRQAGQALGDWRLVGCCLYVTLEPCVMCAGALVNARISQLVYGCMDPKGGAVNSLYEICGDTRLNHRIQVVSGVLQKRCSCLLSDFFRDLRCKRES